MWSLGVTLTFTSSQTMYVELLRRYLLYCGSSSRQAVKLFSSFVTRLIYSQSVNMKLNEFLSEITPNRTDRSEPIMRAM